MRVHIFLGDFIYPRYLALIILIAAACVAGLWFLLQKTPFGRVVRAGVQNPDMVGALGISLQPYMAAVAFLGVGLAGLAGVMLAPAAVLVGCWPNTSFEAVPAVMLNVLLVAPVSPVLAAVSV